MLLAIKCALAGAGGDETLVFDEIDAGIGGRTAVAVANKLRELSGRSQLVVVTHLAQVAALADRHYLIDKVAQRRPVRHRRRALCVRRSREEAGSWASCAACWADGPRTARPWPTPASCATGRRPAC